MLRKTCGCGSVLFAGLLSPAIVNVNKILSTSFLLSVELVLSFWLSFTELLSVVLSADLSETFDSSDAIFSTEPWLLCLLFNLQPKNVTERIKDRIIIKIKK